MDPAVDGRNRFCFFFSFMSSPPPPDSALAALSDLSLVASSIALPSPPPPEYSSSCHTLGTWVCNEFGSGFGEIELRLCGYIWYKVLLPA